MGISHIPNQSHARDHICMRPYFAYGQVCSRFSDNRPFISSHQPTLALVTWRQSGLEGLTMLIRIDRTSPRQEQVSGSLLISGWARVIYLARISLKHTPFICSLKWLKFSEPGIGVTKSPFSNFSVRKIFDLVKVPVRFLESHSYLANVTAAKLRWHLPNINVIFNS